MERLTEFGNQVGYKVIVTVFVTYLLMPGLGLIWASFQTNPQPIFLGLVVVLLSVHGFVMLVFYEKWKESREEARHATQELDDKIQEQGDQVDELLTLFKESPCFVSLRAYANRSGRRLHQVFPVTKRVYDPESQSIILELTNRTGSVFHVREVQYRDNKLLESEIEFQRYSNRGRFPRPLLNFDRAKSDVGPEGRFPLAIKLKRPWQREEIEVLFGDLGRLVLEVEYEGVVEEVRQRI